MTIYFVFITFSFRWASQTMWCLIRAVFSRLWSRPHRVSPQPPELQSSGLRNVCVWPSFPSTPSANLASSVSTPVVCGLLQDAMSFMLPKAASSVWCTEHGKNGGLALKYALLLTEDLVWKCHYFIAMFILMQGHFGKVLYPEEQLLPQNGPLCSPLLFQLKRVCRNPVFLFTLCSICCHAESN